MREEKTKAIARGQPSPRTYVQMEMKQSSCSAELLGGGASPGRKKRPPSRLQKQAPASLQLEPGAKASPAAWGDGRTPIPLLSPLVASPAPVWEADQGGSRREAVHGGGALAEGRSGGEGGSAAQHGVHGGSHGERQADETVKTPAPAPSGGWRHPALLTPAPAHSGAWRHPALPAPVAEPASLVPLFKSQCAVEVRSAQQ